MKEILNYAKYWYFFLITIVVSIGLAYLYLQIKTPKYSITSTMLIQDDKAGDGMLKGTAFSDLQMFKTAKTVENEIEVLRSKDLLYKVLKTLSFETNYSVKRTLGTEELYGETLPVKIITYKLMHPAFAKKLSLTIKDDERFVWEDNGKRIIYRFNQLISLPGYTIRVEKGPAFKAEKDPIDIKFNNLKSLSEAYSASILSVAPTVKDGNTILLSLTDAVPQRGIDFLNTLIEAYNLQDINNKSIMARNTIKFIDNRLKYLTEDLDVVERDVENYKRQNRVTNISADAQIALQNSGDYTQQLANSEVQLNLIRSLESYINQPDNGFGLVPSTLGLKDLTLNDLINKYNNLQMERQQLLRTANDKNPLVVNISDQLANLKVSMRENLRNIKRALLVERNNLNSMSSMLESKVRQVPVIERGLLERSREQSVKQSLYHYLLQKREETELSMSAMMPTSQVVDKPASTNMPVSPKGQLIYLCSLILGAVIPVGFIYCKDKLSTTVKDVTELDLIPGARVLGELSHKGKRETIVVGKGSRTTISELFRYIRNNLHFLNKGMQNQVLLVTSTVKGEGKTFFSINLGITLSLTDKKVCMLEFDLRKPDLLNGLKLNFDKGLSDFLISDKVNLDDIIHPSNISPNLSVIGCGPMPENPAELLLGHRLHLLFELLRKKFDYIIVDTSPVGQVADAFSLAGYADASIYLVRYNYTNKFQLKILQDICENNRFNNPLIVFNDIKETKQSYGYGYGKHVYS